MDDRYAHRAPSDAHREQPHRRQRQDVLREGREWTKTQSLTVDNGGTLGVYADGYLDLEVGLDVEIGADFEAAIRGVRMFNYDDPSNQGFSFKASQPEAVIMKPQQYFSLAPNPSHNSVRLDYDASVSELSQLELCDLQGKVLLRAADMPAGSMIDLSQLPSGIYLARARLGDEIFTQKLVKQ